MRRRDERSFEILHLGNCVRVLLLIRWISSILAGIHLGLGPGALFLGITAYLTDCYGHPVSDEPLHIFHGGGLIQLKRSLKAFKEGQKHRKRNRTQ